jgi:hypothetical protein
MITCDLFESQASLLDSSYQVGLVLPHPRLNSSCPLLKTSQSKFQNQIIAI